MSKRKRSDTATDILTKLTCPVCIDYFTKPTYNCIKGHSICINCFQNLARTGPICPMCRSKYPANPTRNLTVENMLECFPTSCKFSAHGCKETLNLGNRLEHEKICPFDKEVSCPIFNFVVNHEINSVPDMCTWRNSIDSLIEHLYTAHDLKIDGEPEKEVTLN